MKLSIKISIVCVGILFCACDTGYSYSEVKMGKKASSEVQKFKAKDDTTAYLEAYTKFCISKKVYLDMAQEGYGQYLERPVSFAILDKKR